MLQRARSAAVAAARDGGDAAAEAAAVRARDGDDGAGLRAARSEPAVTADHATATDAEPAAGPVLLPAGQTGKPQPEENTKEQRRSTAKPQRNGSRAQRLVNAAVRRKTTAATAGLALQVTPAPEATSAGSESPRTAAMGQAPLPPPPPLAPPHPAESGSGAGAAARPEIGAGVLHRSLTGDAAAMNTGVGQERIADLAKWFVQEWQANLFTGWVFFPHHNDALYRDFVRSPMLNQVIPQGGGRLYAVTAEPWALVRASWRPDANLDLVVDEGSTIARYLNGAGLLTVAVQASVSRRFELIGPAVLFIARSGRVLFAWSRPPGDPGDHGDRASRAPFVSPEGIWRRVRRVLEEEEGVNIVPAPSLQAATADLLRNPQRGWLGLALRRLRFWDERGHDGAHDRAAHINATAVYSEEDGEDENGDGRGPPRRPSM